MAGDAVQLDTMPPTGSMAERADEFCQPQSPNITAEKGVRAPGAGGATKGVAGDAAAAVPQR